jgi:hypothetical protein
MQFLSNFALNDIRMYLKFVVMLKFAFLFCFNMYVIVMVCIGSIPQRLMCCRLVLNAAVLRVGTLRGTWIMKALISAVN